MTDENAKTKQPQKFTVHFRWATLESGSFKIIAMDEDDAVAICKVMFKEKYQEGKCRLEEIRTVETRS